MGSNIITWTHPYAHTMLEHMPVRIALYDAQDLRLLDANTLYLQSLDRFLRSELHGSKVIGLCMSDWGDAKGQGFDFVALFRQVAETGLPYQGDEVAAATREGAITYWNFAIDPVRDACGQVVYLLQTGTEVTRQVQARQQAEQAQKALKAANQELQVEYKWLEIVETIARSVRQSFDIPYIGEIATTAIATHFSTLEVILHVVDPTRQTLSLLSLHTSQSHQELAAALHHFPYEGVSTLRHFPDYHEPLIISDLQKDSLPDIFRQRSIPLDNNTHGFISVPLWFRERLEGVLTVFFADTIEAHGPEIHALRASGTHIASALCQARLHAAVENERAHLHTLLEQLPEGIMIIDVITGSISYANPAAAQLLGMPLTDMLGTPVHQHPAARLPNLTKLYGRPIVPWNFAVVRALAGERLNSEETLIVQPDSKTVVALMSSAPLRLQTFQGVVKEIAIVFQDVTTQKSLEQHKNEFFSVVNHELRTPLTIVQGYAEMLRLHVQQNELLDPFILTAVTNITEQSDQLCRLIEDMLNISRIEHAQFLLQCTQHDLLPTIVRVVESQAATSDRTITLQLDGLQKTDTLMATFDEERIVQVLHNLINNAIKYSSSGKNIDVCVYYAPARNQTVLIQVKDQGIGIAASELPHIFKRFHRAHSHTTSISGFGIGLYLAKEIISGHGGRIWVESKEGVGSTFFIEFPLNAQQT